jgi:hypothetical protein
MYLHLGSFSVYILGSLGHAFNNGEKITISVFLCNFFV